MADNIKKIKQWFENCDLLANGKINVDYLKGEKWAYSIEPTPNNQDITNFIDGQGGKRALNFNFCVNAPISTQVLVNLANSKFCQDFKAWVDTQNRAKNLPDIEGAFKIECTTNGYLMQRTETIGTYIIQMRFTYYEL